MLFVFELEPRRSTLDHPKPTQCLEAVPPPDLIRAEIRYFASRLMIAKKLLRLSERLHPTRFEDTLPVQAAEAAR